MCGLACREQRLAVRQWLGWWEHKQGGPLQQREISWPVTPHSLGEQIKLFFYDWSVSASITEFIHLILLKVRWWEVWKKQQHQTVKLVWLALSLCTSKAFQWSTVACWPHPGYLNHLLACWFIWGRHYSLLLRLYFYFLLYYFHFYNYYVVFYISCVFIFK